MATHDEEFKKHRTYMRGLSRLLRKHKFEEFKAELGDRTDLLVDEEGVGQWLSSYVRDNDMKVVEFLFNEMEMDINTQAIPTISGGGVVVAASEGNVELVQWFLDRGATINHERNGVVSCSALYLACSNGHLEVVKLLVENGAEINGTSTGVNPLMEAEDYGQTSVAEYLKSVGAKRADA